MKNLLFGALVSLSFSAAAQGPTFSAFTFKNKLYATVLGDCNETSASLKVDPLCRIDRLTRDLAIDCAATLNVMATEMMCPADSIKGQVVEIDLAKAKVAPEAQVLHLSYLGKTIDVQINK